MKMTSYESIKSSIMLDFEEYSEQEGLNVVQISAKILEEDWRIVNDSLFTKTLYFVSIAIESLKYNEIADFIYSKLDIYLESPIFEESINKMDIKKLLQDIRICEKMVNSKNKYTIRETSYSGKSRVEYILSLRGD